MSDRTSWAGVVRAYLNSATDAEADDNAKVLADLMEEAGDDETADMLRNPKLSLWIIPPDDVIFEQYHDDFHVVLEKNRIRFHSELERKSSIRGFYKALSWATDDEPSAFKDYQEAEEVIRQSIDENDWQFDDEEEEDNDA